MAFSTEQSRRIYERTLGVLVEGSSSSSRGPANFGKYPIFMERGRGARIYDVDGNQYIDWMMAFGALPLGHAHPEVSEAIAEAAATGAHFATATPVELEVAEIIHSLVPNAERVRFANTGTEAVMAAIRLARGVTGRAKILKFEGHYHGWYDDLLVSSNVLPVAALGLLSDPVKIADSSGLNRMALADTIVVPWNDLSALERALENYPGQIAAIISEGVMANMGVIPPAEGYLQGLEKLARAHGILFILDETVTGFRIAPGGCQQHYKLSPDLVTFGKALGCGLPVAALAGRAAVMDALEWGGVLHYGTQMVRASECLPHAPASAYSPATTMPRSATPGRSRNDCAPGCETFSASADAKRSFRTWARCGKCFSQKGRRFETIAISVSMWIVPASSASCYRYFRMESMPRRLRPFIPSSHSHIRRRT